MTSVWEDPGFRRYWVSRVVSSVGTSITLVAVPVLVYTMSRSAWLTSVATVSVTAANVVFGLIGGAIGDRHDRRKVMVVADLVAAVAIGSVVLAHVAGVLHVAHVLSAAFLTASAATIFDGANWGALPALVGRERLPQANSLVWGAVSVLDVAAPALVGLALAVVQPATLLTVDAVSYLLSAVLIGGIGVAMSTPRDPGGRPRTTITADIGEGLGYLFRHPVLRSLAMLAVLGSAGSAAYLAVVVVWADRVLDVGTSGWRFGMVMGAGGLGAFLGAMLMPRVMRRLGAVTWSRRAIPAVASLVLLLSVVDRYWLAIPAVVLYQTLHTSQYMSVITYRQQIIPPELISRVSSAARMLGWGAGAVTGALVAGSLAESVGARWALVAAAVLHLGGSVLARQPALSSAPVVAPPE